MCSASRFLLVVVAAAFLAALTPGLARADGDPASDYLLSQDVFLPFDAKIPAASAGQLSALIQDAKTHGYPIKVALITTPFDLGAVTPLWRQPQRYAQFLGQELYFVYRGRLLIVMPNGYGVSSGGKAVPSERRVLNALRPPAAGGTGFVTAASLAVQRLAGAHGVRLTLPSAHAGGSTSRDRIVIVAALLGALVLLAAAVFVRRRGRA
jgi:hypothetical protein